MSDSSTYRLYYSSNGAPLYYSIGELSDNNLRWIRVTKEQYLSATAVMIQNNQIVSVENTSSIVDNIPGFLFGHDIQILRQLSSRVPENGTIVEVGSFFGKSAAIMAESALVNVTIYCIDAFPETFVYKEKYKFLEYGKTYNMCWEFQENTKKYKNIKMIIGRSPHITDNYRDQFESINNIDMFFLDAEHTNPSDWENIQYFLPKMKKGGILCGHDYSDKYPDIIDNIKKLEKILNQKVVTYYSSSMWSFKI